MVTALVAIGALALIPSMGWAWGLVAAFGLAYGYYETVYFALSMRATDPRIAASMYSILMAVANIGTGIGLGVTGVLTDVAGFRWTFAILAALNLLALPLMGKVFSSSKQ
jgi:PAT family beta-lactamase induction signal transducer AmpG